MKTLLNIATLSVAMTATIHLKDAGGDLLFADAERTVPLRIIVHSPGSKAFGIVEARQSSRAVKRMQDNDGKITVAPHEERMNETAEDLAAITVGFEGFTYGDGSLSGDALYRAVYADPALGFVTKQVAKFLADWGNFKPASQAA